MTTRFLLNFLSVSKQVDLMRNRGILLGTRKREGRQIYTYMYQNLFAEVLYKNDNPGEPAEKFVAIPGLKKLRDHLSNEVKSAR